jgi:hypothetical protein
MHPFPTMNLLEKVFLITLAVIALSRTGFAQDSDSRYPFIKLLKEKNVSAMATGKP